MSRNLALRVERLETLLALALAKSSGGGVVGGNKPVLGVVYRQGGVSSGNVLATWAEVETAITNAHGVLRVYVDSSITSPSTVQTGHATDCLGNVELWPYRKNAAVRDTLVVKDGSSLHRIRGVFGPLTLQVENKTSPGLTFANADELIVQGDSIGATAIIEGLAAATLPVVDLSAAAQTIIVTATNAELESDQAGIPFFGLGAVSTAVVTTSFVVWQGLIVTGAAGSTLEMVSVDCAGVVFPDASQLAGFTGTLLQGIEPQAPGTSGYDAPWFAAGTIFIDPAAGNDNNAGTTVGEPIKTYAECVRRWGSTSPFLSVETTITFLSSHTDATDPVVCFPKLAGGVNCVIQGAAPTVITADVVLAGTVAKNRAAGANSLLQTNLGATGAAKQLVENTTHASRAWAYKALGGNAFSMTQPMVLLTPPTLANSGPAEVDTWANTNHVNLLEPIAINVAAVGATILGLNGAFSNRLYVYQCTVLDPGGAGNNFLQADSGSQFLECAIERNLVMNGAAIARGFANCIFLGSVDSQASGNIASVDPFIIAGALFSNFSSLFSGSPLLDGDFILGDASSFGQGAFFGCVFLDANAQILGGVSGAGVSDYNGFVGVIYGSAANVLNLTGNAHLGIPAAGSFVTSFTAPGLVTGIKLNGSNTAQSHTGATPDVINSGITTTPAHLDAAAGVAGFGKNAFILGGPSVSNF